VVLTGGDQLAHEVANMPALVALVLQGDTAGARGAGHPAVIDLAALVLVARGDQAGARGAGHEAAIEPALVLVTRWRPGRRLCCRSRVMPRSRRVVVSCDGC